MPVQDIPIPDDPNVTADEERPELDHALPEPPPISSLQDTLAGDPVTPGGGAFVRVVHADGGQSDVADPGA